MTQWSVTFFVFAAVAAIFGFGGLASASMGVAQILFYVFAALGIGAAVMQAIR